MISSKGSHFVRLARAFAGRTHAAAALALFAAVGSIAGTASADILRSTTGYPSQAATAGNPGLGSGANLVPPGVGWTLTAFELTVTQRARIDRFAFVGNTPTPQLSQFYVVAHSSLAAFAANPLNGNTYTATVWNVASEEPFGAGAGAAGMAWNYYTLVHPPGREIVLDPGTYAITIYRDVNWRFADSDIDLGTDWAAASSFPNQLFAWQNFHPSGTAAIDVYATLLACPADFDGSGFVDSDDFVSYVDNFVLGCAGPADPDPACTQSADFDGSTFVDSDDFVAFVSAFEAGC